MIARRHGINVGMMAGKIVAYDRRSAAPGTAECAKSTTEPRSSGVGNDAGDQVHNTTTSPMRSVSHASGAIRVA